MFYNESSKNCFYCQAPSTKSYQFTCSHYICHICLYRQLFCYQLKDFQTSDQIEVKCKCKDGELHLSLDDIEETLTEKTYTDNCQVQEIFKDDIFCKKHPSNYVNSYCVECSQLVCKECSKINDSEHFCHRIVPGHKLANTLKSSISSLPLSMKTREEFLDMFKGICRRVKDVCEKNFAQIMEQLDDLTNTMIRYKKQYEIEFKHELANIVKKLNLYRMFYLHYYYDMEVAEVSPNLNLSRYLNNISDELIDAQITLDASFETKLSLIKRELDMLRKSNEKKLNANYVLNPVQRNFIIEEKLKQIHNKEITAIIQTTNDELLVTGSLDHSIKFWEEGEIQGFEPVITINKMTGQIIHLKELSDGKIVSASLNDNTLRIWIKINSGYQTHQTLNGHNRTITSIAQLKDGKLLSSSKDTSVIVWKKNDSDLFAMMQKIYESDFPIVKVLGLFDNRFVAASQDTIIRFYTENEIENKFICSQQIQGLDKPVYCWCQLKNGQLLTSCESKVIIRWKDIYHNKEYKPMQKAVKHIAEVLSIVQCKDSRVATSSIDHTIIIWKVEDKGMLVAVETICDCNHGIHKLIQLSDGRLCGVVSKSEVWIWRNRNNSY